ncbi:hypothetical protein COK05_09030 [Bacillus cereus]|uniref:DOD-type homing endonuclease domain-containing protein n=1 Tax=Bacillus cereus TaxID=1396 RepID=A0A2B2LSR1_BACCE|nr:LAGLIDADG family homing endonuclease [Bacillus cereus]PFQ47864.1 hypothetical protein COK05_09030 [Bacillus cereus]
MPRPMRKLNVTYEDLYNWHHIDRLTLKEIQELLKTSYRALSRTMKELGVPIKRAADYKIKYIPNLNTERLDYLYNVRNLSIKKIANLFNVSECTIQTKFRDLGIPKRTSGESRSKFFWDQFPFELMAQLYNRFNKNINKIAVFLNQSPSSVTHSLRIYGLLRSREQYFEDVKAQNDSVNPDFFKTMSKELAYILGLLLTDGCLSPDNGISIELIDEDVVNWIAQTIHYKHEVKKRYRNGNWHYKIQFRNAEVICELMKYGMTYQKTTTVECPDIPKRFRPAFIRGVFEGDGSVGNKKKNYIIMFSASKPFMEKIKQYVEELIGGNNKLYCAKSHRKKPLYTYTRSSMVDIIAFWDAIYKNCTYGMERKKKIFRDKYGCNI